MNAIRNEDFDAGKGFAVKVVTADLARRQLNVSLGVMGLMVAAALTIVSTVGFAPKRPEIGMRAELTVQQPQFVRPMTAQASSASDRTGG